MRKQVESSLVVKGTVDITADGRVLGYALDHADKLAPAVKQLLARTVPQWQFEPVTLDPDTDRGRAPMSVRLVAKKLDGGDYRIEVRGAQFGSHRRDHVVRSVSMSPPRYPMPALHARVGGTVYVVALVGHDGRVVEAAAEQVNLGVIASETEMAAWRRVFAQAAVGGAKQWTFEPPATGPNASAGRWAVRVPVDFVMMDDESRPPPNEFEWRAYVPGPRMPLPWARDAESAEEARSGDALASGTVHLPGLGLRLRAPLGAQ
ncbi:hypothetical protein GCM10007067_20430 [Lysobacter bugurensis]|uniref:Energy transducer TonB n=1 Tax=Cognatilysobacter bugurensis TaxID=543356 RepID=A0A918WA67_9GAMM|nr:hypothetical protein GCM10007067_20430 [Lysobacter bugurensis]